MSGQNFPFVQWTPGGAGQTAPGFYLPGNMMGPQAVKIQTSLVKSTPDVVSMPTSAGCQYKVAYVAAPTQTPAPAPAPTGPIVLNPTNWGAQTHAPIQTQPCHSQYPVLVDLSQLYKNCTTGTAVEPQQKKTVKKWVNNCCPGCGPCCCGKCNEMVEMDQAAEPEEPHQGCCMCPTGCCQCCNAGEDEWEYEDEEEEEAPAAATEQPATPAPAPASQGCCACTGCKMMCCGNTCCACKPCGTDPGCCGQPAAPAAPAAPASPGCCGPSNQGCCGAPHQPGCCGTPGCYCCGQPCYCCGNPCCPPHTAPAAQPAATEPSPVCGYMPVQVDPKPIMPCAYRSNYNIAGFVPYPGQPCQGIPIDKRFVWSGPQVQPYASAGRVVFNS